jgi:hypothetical protein
VELLRQAEYMAATGFIIHPTIAFRSGLGPDKAHKGPRVQAMGRSSDQTIIDSALCCSSADAVSNFWPANSHNNAKRYIAPASR